MNPYTSASCGVGFVCTINGSRSHEILSLGIEAVKNLTHRGAMGADGKTGDGAGVLIQIPWRFFKKEFPVSTRAHNDRNNLALGVFFLSSPLEEDIERILRQFRIEIMGWRDVPVDDDALGNSAVLSRPRIRHLLLDTGAVAEEKKEATLYLARRSLEKTFAENLYVCSLSSRIMIYKGMLVAQRLDEFYPDLRHRDLESAFCIFHQRFSTNTSPDWRLAQPFRVLAHNGEINTLQGNRNAISMLEHEVQSTVFGDRNDLLAPLIHYDESDSASLDRVLELLILAGFSPEHGMMLCVPPAWEESDLHDEEKAFFDYQSLLMRPWDGPAALVYTDGRKIGAHLDRNGLRPLRYVLTHDGLLVMASEIGVIDLGERSIREKGRLGPGEIISVDLETGRLRYTEEIISGLAAEKPYRDWLARNRMTVTGEYAGDGAESDMLRKQAAFGYTGEEIEIQMREMGASGKELVFSMGDDTPLPPLSAMPQLLFRYFKQRFSQVTNPPIDPIRERMVMSLRMNLGYKRNFLAPAADHARRLLLDSPVLHGNALELIRNEQRLRHATIDITYDNKKCDLAGAVASARAEAVRAVAGGAHLVILSDRNLSASRPAIPSLLAASACFTALRIQKCANRASIVIDTGEARDVHHLACLIGYGASAVYPWLAYATIIDLVDRGMIACGREQAVLNYVHALEEGLLNVMARMGISTLRSYHGAQLFDSICLNKDFIDDHFPGTPHQIGAHGLSDIEHSLIRRHETAFRGPLPSLHYGGMLKYRKDGEQHAWSPQIVQALNRFMRSGNDEDYRKFSKKADEQAGTIRQLLGYREGTPVPLDTVEPEESILKRFFSGAMSVGALSPEAHETIAEACNALGIKSNSGEGGEDPARYRTIKGSAIKQIASGRFGVTPAYLASASDLEIKIAQGAKPGEGGHLPGSKVSEYIAGLRHCKPGTLLISPPPHHDIYSIEDLAQLVYDLKQANPEAHVCVKLVSEAGVGTVAAGVAKSYADSVQISGCEGGTGAASISSIRNAGSHWETGLSETVRVLMENGLRNRVRVRVDGGLRTGRDIVIAALLGAEEFGFGTATMISAGCVMARQCHSNTCPTGIATQDETLRKRFRGTVRGITGYFRALAREVREILAAMGATRLHEIIGRTDLLLTAPASAARHPDLAALLSPYPDGVKYCTLERNDNPAPSMNDRIAEDLLPAVENGIRTEVEYDIRNTHRSIPARLNYLIARKYGDLGLPDDTIRITFKGAAGQSFGAFNHRGLSLTLLGDANDYAGKGMFGGRIVIIPSDIKDEPHRHVIVGNTVLYGAIGGEFFAAGFAGERFAVRNSGARAVIEGAGLHLCEYMTRGTVVALGEVGRNVGAGMTGGAIYILDPDDKLTGRINRVSVRAGKVEQDADIEELRSLLVSHFRHTGSAKADEIISDFNRVLPLFKKVVPK